MGFFCVCVCGSPEFRLVFDIAAASLVRLNVLHGKENS